MKRTASANGLLGLGIAAVLLFAGATSGVTTDGKAVFTANKCNTCHGVAAAGIAKVDASSKAPDLSSTGLRHNAAWFTKYLLKQEELNGAKHVKKFKGSDADLSAIATWLAAQKKR